jgi:hypothetical protein
VVAGDRNDDTSGVDQLLQFYAEIIKLARPMVVGHRQPAMTEIACGTRKLDTFVRLDGGIDVPKSRFMFAPAEELEPAPHDIHVLLRHHPCSIPRELWRDRRTDLRQGRRDRSRRFAFVHLNSDRTLDPGAPRQLLSGEAGVSDCARVRRPERVSDA